jgi:hypothetical protein
MDERWEIMQVRKERLERNECYYVYVCLVNNDIACHLAMLNAKF